MKRVLYLCISGLLLLIGLLGCAPAGNGSGSTSTPTTTATIAPTSAPGQQPTTTPTSGENQALQQVATQYYNLIKAKNYSQAYTYLDPNATDANGHTITQSSFLQMAQAMDSQEGSVTDFTVSAFAPTVIATVTRSQMGPYHAHLQMKQEGNTWKIISLDRI